MNNSSHIPGATPPKASAPRRSNWVLITTAIVGGIVLIGAVGAAALSGLTALTKPSNESPQLLTADASDMTNIRVDASAADVSVTCDRDGEHAEELAVLTASEGPQRWHLRMERETLRVGTERGHFGWLGGINLFGWGAWQPQTVSISLPEHACEGGTVSADFDLSSGRLLAKGEFDALRLDVSAGDAMVAGAARTVEADVSAGGAELLLADVEEAKLQVSAGGLTGAFTGDAPRQLRIDVSAGEIDLELPDVPYLVSSDVSAGSFDNFLRTGGSTADDHRVDVDVSAGGVTLRPGG